MSGEVHSGPAPIVTDEGAFEAERRSAAPRAATLLSLLAIGAFLGFGVVDPFLIEGSLAPAYTVRAVTVVILGGLIAANRQRSFAERHAVALALATFWTIAASVTTLTWMTGGGASRYHEALILVIFAAALLPFSWSVRTATACFVSAVAVYDVVMVVTARMGSVAEFGSNNAILLTAAAIGGVGVMDSERRRRQEWSQRQQLAAANERLQAVDRAKSRFFANLSHELRTPLTLAIAPVHSLLGGSEPMTPTQRDQLQLVERNALRLLRLVDDLLELARAEGAALRLRPESTDLVELVRQLAKLAEPLARNKGLELLFDAGPESLEVQVDRQQIERVLLNLLSNAAKFTDHGEIRVAVRADGAWAHVTVQDTGIGIPDAEIERVFDRFHQVDDSGTRSHGGTGIGLALVKELVALHGGTVTAKSVVGAGTTMEVSLPIRAGATAPIERRKESRVAATERRSAPTGLPEWHEALRRATSYRFSDLEQATGALWTPAAGRVGNRAVLVIEDNADMRSFLGSLLSARFEVLMAPDGMDGLRTAVERRPDLVISDVMMPGITGFEVVRRLRATPATADVPVILLTARGEVEDRVEGRGGGADAYLTKPFNPDELLAAVEGLLRRKGASEEMVRRERDEALQTLASGLGEQAGGPLAALDAVIAGAPTELRTKLDPIVERLRTVLEDLRGFALAGTGGPAGVVPIEAVLRRAHAFLPGEIARRVRIDGRSRQGVRVGDAELERVILHLIDNAVRACRAGGVVTVTSADEGAEVVLKVQDEGSGVPPEAAERIFAPYYSTREDGGTGLGLSVSRQVVRSLGGSLELERTSSAGALFVVRLPAAQ